MKGSKKVVKTLNDLLAFELTAADHYFVHSQMFADWGLNHLHDHIKHEWEEELEHARRLIERILFLEGTPNVADRLKLNIGKDTPSMLKHDLDTEYLGVKKLKDAISLCEKEQDYHTRTILEGLLDDTEMDHAYWLEKQLGLIDKMGLPNYIEHSAGHDDTNA